MVELEKLIEAFLQATYDTGYYAACLEHKDMGFAETDEYDKLLARSIQARAMAKAELLAFVEEVSEQP